MRTRTRYVSTRFVDEIGEVIWSFHHSIAFQEYIVSMLLHLLCKTVRRQRKFATTLIFSFKETTTVLRQLYNHPKCIKYKIRVLL